MFRYAKESGSCFPYGWELLSTGHVDGFKEVNTRLKERGGPSTSGEALSSMFDQSATRIPCRSSCALFAPSRTGTTHQPRIVSHRLLLHLSQALLGARRAS